LKGDWGVTVKIKTFSVTMLDKNLDYVKDSEGRLNHYNINISLDEALELIAEAVKIGQSKYGYEVYLVKNNGHISIYFRFGNVTVKKKDNIEGFIRKNWDEAI